MATDLQTLMTTCPVIPVMVIERPEHAVPMAQALVSGGLSVLEVTLRTEHGLEAITAIKQAVPGAVVGAGTVVTDQDLLRAVSAGAEFLVSPGSPPQLIEAALECSIPLLPGVATPTEAMTLLERNFTHMKFFPAEAAGGVPMLKSIAGPLPGIRFCPTGGVNPSNAAEYLALDNVLCVGGSWMLDAAVIASGDWGALEAAASKAAALGSG